MALFPLVLAVVAAAHPAVAVVAPGDAATMAVDGAGKVQSSDSTLDGQNMMRREVPRMHTQAVNDAGSILETNDTMLENNGPVLVDAGSVLETWDNTTCASVADDRVTCPSGLCTCSPGKVIWYHAGELNYCVANGERKNGENLGVHIHYGSATDKHASNCDSYFNVPGSGIKAAWSTERNDVSSVAGDVRNVAQCLNNVGWSADATHFGKENLCGGAGSSNECPSTVPSDWMFKECQFSRDGTGMTDSEWCCSGDYHMCVLKCPDTASTPDFEVKCGTDHDTPQTTFLRGMDVCTEQPTKTCEIQTTQYANYRACAADQWWACETAHSRYQSR